ncbi:hypothetical protein [Paramagnetospirillum magneticum]|nr:hypothetical protein [Paramagnetospirillum magneticum]
MIKTITVAGAALLLSSAVAWAQVPGGVVALSRLRKPREQPPKG